MQTSLNVLEDVRRCQPSLKKSEALVADLVLGDPQSVLGLNVTSLAQKAGVSEATVVRFCRSVGCAGFPDFKLRLAEGQARGTPYVSEHVAPDDDVPALSRKIFSSAVVALSRAAEQSDDRAMARAIALVAGASRILCVGVGGSGALAQDAAHKLLRLGYDAQSCTDPVLARMLLVNLAQDGVLLILSNTGRTLVVNGLAEQARQQGAAVVAVTAPNSPLARLATVPIGSSPVEDADIYTPMASRLVQLTLIDILSTGVALEKGDSSRRHLAQVKAVLTATRQPKTVD